MSLKLQLKEWLFKILDVLQAKHGYFLYNKIQEAVNGENMLQRVKSNERSYDTLQRLLKTTDHKLEGKKILEIGSGWAAVMPYFMLFHGKAQSVATFDLNRHFSEKNNKQLLEVFSMKYGRK